MTFFLKGEVYRLRQKCHSHRIHCRLSVLPYLRRYRKALVVLAHHTSTCSQAPRTTRLHGFRDAKIYYRTSDSSETIHVQDLSNRIRRHFPQRSNGLSSKSSPVAGLVSSSTPSCRLVKPAWWRATRQQQRRRGPSSAASAAPGASLSRPPSSTTALSISPSGSTTPAPGLCSPPVAPTSTPPPT